MRKFLVLFLGMVLLASLPGVSAQEKEVCLVYLTGNVCGDECRLTDSFMDGLINEYSENLVTIKYNIDISQENKNIFEAYRSAYNLPSGVPLILFGKNDYISGMYNIFRNAEPRIYSLIKANGTNCPLKSGYIPPGSLNPDDLPGEPEFYEGEEETPEEPDKEEGDGDDDLVVDENGRDTTQIPTPIDLKGIQEIYGKDPLFLILLVIVVILVAVLAVMFIKRVRKS